MFSTREVKYRNGYGEVRKEKHQTSNIKLQGNSKHQVSRRNQVLEV
jgi:hypothetical protein